MSKALTLLKSNKSVKERADKYSTSIQRDIQQEVLDVLSKKKEKMEDQLFDLENFNLETNLNSGHKQMTQEDCKERFKKIIDLKYQTKLVEYELEIKQKAFNEYFGSK